MTILLYIFRPDLTIIYFYDIWLSFIYKKLMKSCGKNIYIRPYSSDIKGLSNISIGNNVSIPKNSVIYCTNAELKIGNNVIFGPHPTIITGDHNIKMIGRYIIDVQEKSDNNDLPIIIEDDVWTGSNITILKGVTIGRGSVIAAGAVVNKSCPPYSIIGGIPAKVLKRRFTIGEILEHEAKLYPEEKRFSRKELEELYK